MSPKERLERCGVPEKTAVCIIQAFDKMGLHRLTPYLFLMEREHHVAEDKFQSGPAPGG